MSPSTNEIIELVTWDDRLLNPPVVGMNNNTCWSLVECSKILKSLLFLCQIHS